MKKIILSIVIIICTTNIFAQLETGIKLGESVSEVNTTDGGKAGFYYQGAFGYRFLKDKRVTLIPSFFIDKSAYTINNLTFGGITYNNNGTASFQTSTLSYQLYGIGINVNSEIKLRNLDRKTNFYISPSLGYRRIFLINQKASNPNLDVSKHPNISQGTIIDWGLDLGVKLQKIKLGLFLRNILNMNNRNMSSFVITNAFGLSANYLFNLSFKKKEQATE